MTSASEDSEVVQQRISHLFVESEMAVLESS
jgi:hypothetical protein